MLNKFPNRKVGQGIILAILTVAVLAALAAILPELAKSPEEWVLSQAGRLPGSYEEISSFPAAYRIRILAELPAADQARLWKEHLQRSLQARPHLSAGQKSLIEEAMSWTAARRYRQMRQSAASGTASRAMLELAWQIEGLFTRQQAGEIFYQLGTPQPTYRAAASWPIWVSQAANGLFSSSARGTRCNCSVGAPLPPTCFNPVCVLSTSCVSAACGPIGGLPCNGCC